MSKNLQNPGPVATKIKVRRACGAGLEASWAVLAHPCVFGGVLDRLGGILEGSWRPLGRQHGCKLDPKTEKIDAEMPSQVGFAFLLTFGQFFMPTWTLRTRFGTSGLIFFGIFRVRRRHRFGIRFGGELGSVLAPKID